MVTAVVQNYIYASHLLNNRLQKAAVSLRADSNLPIKAVQFLTLRINVNTKNNGIIAKVFSPQMKTTAIAYANLKKSYFWPAER